MELKNIDPKYLKGDLLERLVVLKTEMDISISKEDKNLSSTVDDMNKLVMELVENLKS